MTWEVASFVLLGLALAAGFAWWERSRPPAKVLALVATLAALAVIGRVAFAALPNVKPTTDIVLLSGYVLGGAPGFAVGAVAALASNLFLGQGPWTPWQMTGWGLVGVAGAALATLTGRRLGRVGLAAACGAAGLFYGALLDLYVWTEYTGSHTLGQYLAISGRSLPFNLAHAAGNVVFCLAFGPALVRALSRFRDRFEVVWRPLPVTAGTIAVLAFAGALAAMPAPASAAASDRAVSYLRSVQTAGGGFAAQRGSGAANELHSDWAIMGLAAVGRDPSCVRRGGGRSAAGYVAARPRPARIGDLERTILARRAAGRSARALAGDLARRRARNGSFGGQVTYTAFAIFALRAAGRSTGDGTVKAAARYIAGQQNRDGGFNVAGRGGPSGIDDTSSAVQALVAAGRRRTPTVRRAIAWLVRRQNRDGGFPLTPGQASNAQSTAWAVQALVAARRDPDRVRRNGSRTPLGYLRTLQAPDGSIRYSRTSRQTPTWVTGQALLAFGRKALPVKLGRRCSRGSSSAPRAAAPAPPAGRGDSAPAAEPRADGGRREARRPRALSPRARRALAAARLVARADEAGKLMALVLAPVVE